MKPSECVRIFDTVLEMVRELQAGTRNLGRIPAPAAPTELPEGIMRPGTWSPADYLADWWMAAHQALKDDNLRWLIFRMLYGEPIDPREKLDRLTVLMMCGVTSRRIRHEDRNIACSVAPVLLRKGLYGRAAGWLEANTPASRNAAGDNPNAKLDEELVREIRQLAKQDIPHSELAFRYNVSPRQIRNIVAKRAWAGVGR